MPPRPPPASLLASATPWRRHAAPSGLSQLPPVLIPFSCSPSRSAPRTQTEPSPPTPFAAATIPLSPPRRLPELRSASLDLLDVSRDQKGPEQPPSSSSPSVGPGAVLRRIRPLRRAPELADPPCAIPVSSTPFPLLHFVRFRAVAPRPHSRAPPSAMDAGHGTDVLLRPVRRA